MSGIRSLPIIVAIASAGGIIIFVLDISNAFQNTILSDPVERVYISLPYLYLDLYKKKMSKTSISLKKSEGIMYPGNKVNSREKICWGVLVWITKINIQYCKNDQELIWSFCITMGLQ